MNSAQTAGHRGGWQRQAESAELADGVSQHVEAIGKLRLPLPPILNALKSSQTLTSGTHGFLLIVRRSDG